MKEVSDKSVTDSRIFTSRLPVRAGTGLMVTPIIDILFLLFAFVAVGSTLSNFAGQQIDPPSSHIKQNPRNVNLVITLTEKGKIYFNSKNPKEMVDLAGEISRFKRTEEDVTNDKNHVYILLRADRNAPYDKVSQVISLCQENNLHVILFVDEKEKQ